MDVELKWWPQERQLRFLRACGMSIPFEDGVPGPGEAEAEVVGYGGAAGGGKTDSLLALGIIAGLVWPGCRVGFFRRTYPELEGPGGVIDRSYELLGGWAGWHGGKREWTLPTGSRIRFCHCQREGDVHKYQSQQFDVLLLDEATHFTQFQVEYLRTRNRATRDGVVPLAAMGTNPGNVGHLWFKDGFVDVGPAEQVHEVDVEGEPEKHVFIPARLSDNKILEQRDPGYRNRLKRQGEDVRRALLEGDWDVFQGQVFKEWSRRRHVVKPFAIPEDWVRWRAVDWGFREPFCCLWLATPPSRKVVVVYREVYKAGLTDPEQAEKIVEMTGEEKVTRTVADPSMWTKRTTERQTVSSADVYARHGVRLTRADNDRLGGKRRVQEALGPRWGTREEVRRKERGPGLLVFETCTSLIRTLPALPYDPVVVEDVDTKAEDHAYDALRYGLGWKVRKRREPERGVAVGQRVKAGLRG